MVLVWTTSMQAYSVRSHMVLANCGTGGRKVTRIGEEGSSEAVSAVTAVDQAPLPTGHVKLQPMVETPHLVAALTSNCNGPVNNQ